MASAMDVANFFIDITKDSDDPMTNLRVQKFLYFAQGWSLVCLGRPMFDDETEAWMHGPVVSDVYHEFSSHGKGHIEFPRDDYSNSVFTNEEIELLIDVALKYRPYSTGGLVDLCHSEDGAWKAVYGSNNSIISKDLIRKEFSEKEKLERFNLKDVLEKMESVGYRDSEGYTVLPKELYE